MDPKMRSRFPPAEEPASIAPPAVFLQEQHTGPLPAQVERTAAEVLAERLEEASSGTDSPAFIP